MQKILIIIPAHNEEKYIDFCLKSLLTQSYGNFEIRIVNDGSTDKTPEILANFGDSRITVINLKKSGHSPGAKVVQTFYKGLEYADYHRFDIICKFDADIIFPKNYLEKIVKIYSENPKAGMVSGILKISDAVFDESSAFDFSNEKGDWRFENISSKDHIRGPIKSYRKECFIEIGGLRPVLGWDNIDVMMAQMQGYETITDKNLWVKHLRPTGNLYKNKQAKKLGEYFHNIGLNFPLAAVSSLKSSLKNRNPFEFPVTMLSYLSQKSDLVLTEEEKKYIQKSRWEGLKKKFRL